MSIRKYNLPMNLGHAHSFGSGFGADSLTDVSYLNLPEGYANMNNFVYREDGILRPPFGVDNIGYTVGTGEVRSIASMRDEFFAIGGDAKLYYNADIDAVWNAVTWTGSGSEPTLPTGKYSWAQYQDGRVVFKNIDNAEVTFIMDPYTPVTDKNWQCVASNSTGERLIAGVYNGRIYKSSNYGSTWTEIQPAGDVNKNWYCTASDSTGQYLIACSTWSGGRIYISSDYGSTWTESRPAGDVDKRWECVASNSTGERLIVGNHNGQAYISSNYGNSWNLISVSGEWESAASDADGSNLIINRYNNIFHTYISSNYGSTWSFPGIQLKWYITAKPIYATTSDATGQHLIACMYGGRVYRSSNYGSTWTEGDANKTWRSAASSSDGSRLILCTEYGGRIYISSDYGSTWTESRPAGDVDKRWMSVSSDSTGQHLIACVYGGRVYISSDYGATWTKCNV